MPATNTVRIPRLPAAARKAGAVSIRRCSANVFSVGYALEGDDFAAPGKGAAVRDALAAAFGASAEIAWDGEQRHAIVLTFA